MHCFPKIACCLPPAGVGRQQCQRPTLDAGVASVQCLQMADSHFKTPILLRSLFSVFYRFFGLLQPLCMLPIPLFWFCTPLCPIFRVLHRFLLHCIVFHAPFASLSAFCIVFRALHCFLHFRTIFSIYFALSLACRLHCLVFLQFCFLACICI